MENIFQKSGHEAEQQKLLESKMSSCKKVERECCINKELLPYKIHYFLLSGAHVGVVPYLPIYAKTRLGCSATAVGILATCMQFSTTISKPLFGVIADCLNQMKILIALLLAVEVILNLLMLTLAPVANTNPANLSNVLTVGTDVFLRISPARVYDASISFHRQPTVVTSPFKEAKYSTGQETARHGLSNTYSPSIHFARQNHSFSKVHATQKLHNLQHQKCRLNCESFIVDAMCNKNSSCIKTETANILSCSLTRKTIIPFCGEFRKGANFAISFQIMEQLQRHKTTYDLMPHIFVHNKFHRNGKHFCNITSVTCNLNCNEALSVCNKNSEDEAPNPYMKYQFWLFCIFSLLGAMCQGALYTLSDTVCYERLRGTTANFGSQRLWGAIGYGAVAAVTGCINDLVAKFLCHEHYTSGWYIMAVLSFCCLVNLYFMKIPETKKSPDICKDFSIVVCNRQFVLMEINVFFLGVLSAYTSNYVIWYMESLGCTSMQMGLSLAVACVLGEGPFMYFSEWLIRKLGHWNIVTLAFIAFATRFGAYYMIVNPWLFLPVELIDGITYGLLYTTITSFGQLISTPGTEGTIQGLLGGTYQGLGSGVGCLVAGISFDNYGGRLSFLLVSIGSACLALSHSVLYIICKPKKRVAENSFHNLKT